MVTTASDEGPVGITANIFSSLSLDPALVIQSQGIGSRRLPFFENAQYFTTHILSADQEYLYYDFAKSPFGFENTEVSFKTKNVPLIKTALCGLNTENVPFTLEAITSMSSEKSKMCSCVSATHFRFLTANSEN